MSDYYAELNSCQTNRANEFVTNQGGIGNIKAKIENAQESQQSAQDFLWSLENGQNELHPEPPIIPYTGR